MNTNLYHEFNEHFSFNSVKELVQSLDARLETDAPKAYDEHEESIDSLLQDLSWDKLNRKGIQTRWEHTSVSYRYERPMFKLSVCPIFDSESRKLQKTVLRATIGHEMNSLIPSSDTRTTVCYVVQPDGHVKQKF